MDSIFYGSQGLVMIKYLNHEATVADSLVTYATNLKKMRRKLIKTLCQKGIAPIRKSAIAMTANQSAGLKHLPY